MSNYQLPSNIEDHASLVFRNTGTKSFFRFMANGADCSDTKKIPDEYFVLDGNSKPLPIAANKEVAVLWSSLEFRPGIISSCVVVLSFQPKPDVKYISEYKYEDFGCSASILRFDESKNMWIGDETVVNRKFRQPFLETGSWCEPK